MAFGFTSSSSEATDARSQAQDKAQAAGGSRGSVNYVTFGDKPFYNHSEPLWPQIVFIAVVLVLSNKKIRKKLLKPFHRGT